MTLKTLSRLSGAAYLLPIHVVLTILLFSGCGNENRPCITHPNYDVVAVGDEADYQAGFMNPSTSYCSPKRNERFRWFTSNSNVLTVEEPGHVRGMSPGTAVLYVEYDGDHSKSPARSRHEVRVVPSIDSIAIHPLRARIDVGDTMRYSAHVYNADGDSIPGLPISVSSSNSAIAYSVVYQGVIGTNPGKTVVCTEGIANYRACAKLTVIDTTSR